MDITSMFGKKKETEDLTFPERKIEFPPTHVEVNDDNKAEIKILQEHMAVIENDFNGIGNIPIDHVYYKLRTQIQRLQSVED